MKRSNMHVRLTVLIPILLGFTLAVAAPQAGNEAALKSADITGKIFPDQCRCAIPAACVSPMTFTCSLA